jgi:hypothetical protein
VTANDCNNLEVHFQVKAMILAAGKGTRLEKGGTAPDYFVPSYDPEKPLQLPIIPDGDL